MMSREKLSHACEESDYYTITNSLLQTIANDKKIFIAILQKGNYTDIDESMV